MVPFCRTLLKRGTGIAVEDMRSGNAIRIVFDRRRIGEFRSVVSYAHLEDLPKKLRSETFIKTVKGCYNGSRIIMAADEGKHHFCPFEMNCKKNAFAFHSFDGVKFNDRYTWMLFHEGEEVLPGPADPAFFVYLGMHCLLAYTKPDFSYFSNLLQSWGCS